MGNMGRVLMVAAIIFGIWSLAGCGGGSGGEDGGGGTLQAPGLQVTQTTSSSVTLAWTTNATDITTFELQRGGPGAWQAVASLGASTRDYTDSGLNASTPYQYQIRVMTTTATSGWSAVVSTTTPGQSLATVTGTVLALVDGSPLAGALVTLGAITIATDSFGQFLFDDITPGQYTLTVTSPGFSFGSPATLGIVGGQNALGTITMVSNTEGPPPPPPI